MPPSVRIAAFFYMEHNQMETLERITTVRQIGTYITIPKGIITTNI